MSDSRTTRVLLTGANGMVGQGILANLSSMGRFQLICPVRRQQELPVLDNMQACTIGGLSASTRWQPYLQDVEVVIHAAARVHVMRETAVDPLVVFREVNVAGTLALAQQAVEAGVRRFIYLSSIKVNGEETPPGQPFHADHPPQPRDPYGISKYEAEQALFDLQKESGLEVVVIRPCLVYGPGVKGNFLSLLRWLKAGYPLPTGGIHQRRSLLARDNLVDLIRTCIHHPHAAGQVFMASDGQDLTVSQFVGILYLAMGKTDRQFHLPAEWVRVVLAMMGKKHFYDRLWQALEVDIDTTRQRLSWTPPVAAETALRMTVHHFLAEEM